MCDVKRCRQYPVIGYIGHEVCQKHWDRHCNDDDAFDLKVEFGIEEVSQTEGYFNLIRGKG